MIYHGVKQNASGAIYRLGLALFDLNNPEICFKRSDEWVFGPEEPYENHGDVDKVVFPAVILLPRMETHFDSTMEQPIPALPWRLAAFRTCFNVFRNKTFYCEV